LTTDSTSNPGPAAPYRNCPCCGLSIHTRRPRVAITYCPRCLGRTRTIVELFSSRMPADTLYANNSLPQPAPKADPHRPSLGNRE
jgi:Zn-finger nucleic acid-binding protein